MTNSLVRRRHPFVLASLVVVAVGAQLVTELREIRHSQTSQIGDPQLVTSSPRWLDRH